MRKSHAGQHNSESGFALRSGILGKMRRLDGSEGPVHGATGPQTRFAGPQLYDPDHDPEYPGHRQKIGYFLDPDPDLKVLRIRVIP